MNNACTFSVEAISNSRHEQVLAIFTSSAEKVWKEDSNSERIQPQQLKSGNYKYMPWGGG